MLTSALFALLALYPATQSNSRGREPIALEPVPKAAAAPKAVDVSGTLCGLDGRPLDGVKIMLQGRSEWHQRFERGSAINEHLVTDGQGRFELSRPLDPRLRYVFRWKGDRVSTGSSGWFTAEDLGSKIALEAVARRPLHGRLILPDGSAVREAEVRVRSQGESTTTNEAGEFRLAHVAESPEPVLVREAGGQVHWMLLQADDAWQDIVLREAPLPSAARSQGSPAKLSAKAKRALASQLRIEWLDAAIQSDNYIDTRWRLLDVAKFDLGAALTRLASPKVDAMFARASIWSFNDRSTCGVSTNYDSHVRAGVDLREFAEAQLRLAAETKNAEVRSAYDALVKGPQPGLLLSSRLGLMGDQFLSSGDRELTPLQRARRDVERAASQSLYQQVGTYSRAALKLLELGHAKEAKEVMGRARAIVAPGQTPSFLSDQYVRALSAFDLDASLELIRAKKSPRDRYSGLSEVAARIAAESPQQAVEILIESEAVPAPKYSGRRSRWRFQETIYRLSAHDFEEAERLARQYDWSGFSLGLLALSVDRCLVAVPEEARQKEVDRLLTAAYARAEDESSRLYRDKALASLVAVAREIRGPDLRRWVGESLWWTAPASGASDTETILAWNLRDIDPALSSALAFAAVSQQMSTDPFGNDSWAMAAWWDPERTAKLALREGGVGLEETAAALEQKPGSPALRSRVATGFFWPKD